jgi:polyvinyl alcohol dehydrogenase (cytochrome)
LPVKAFQSPWRLPEAGPPAFVPVPGVTAQGGALDAAGPVVAGGMVYVHTGYWGRTGPGSVLLAFSVDGK